MKLTGKLLSFLNRVFDKRPHEFLALRLDYDGPMTWTVSDGVLSTAVSGGSGSNLLIDLSAYTVTELAYYLEAQPGYHIAYHDRTDYAHLSGLLLLDATGDPALSNGDHIYGYTSPLYGYMEPMAAALETVESEVKSALQQMEIPNAAEGWLDYWGSFFGYPRTTGELDPDYASRIVISVMRPRGNNVAIEQVISESIGGQKVRVIDVTEYGPTAPLFNNVITFDGSHQYDATQVPVYGLFDVTYGYDLLSSKDPTEMAAYVQGIVDLVRDAGTHMRSLLLEASALQDTVDPASDEGLAQDMSVVATMADTVAPPTESLPPIPVALSAFSDAVTGSADSLSTAVTYATHYDGQRYFNGKIPYQSGNTVTQTL